LVRGAADLWHPCPLRLLKATNVLWKANGRLSISRTALAIQRAYCARVEQFIATAPDFPSWCGEAVAHWGQTLSQLEHEPLCLTDRLDPFIKLALFDAALQAMGRSWSQIAGDRDLYRRLALLDVAYHQVGDDGPFGQLRCEARLPNRLRADPAAGPRQAQGSEAVPHIVELARRLPTRAASRAALIAALCGEGPGIQCNWNGVWRANPAGRYDLDDPTRTDIPPWELEATAAQVSVPHDRAPRDVESAERLGSLMQRVRRLLAERQG
jgi:hypothetical protein